MKFSEIKYISDKLNSSYGKRKFVNFTRAFAFISLLLGTASLIIAMSVLDGFENELRNTAVKFSSHINLRLFDNKPLKNYPQIINNIKNEFDEIKTAEPIVLKEALIRGKGNLEGIIIKGINFDSTGVFNKEKIIKGDIPNNNKSILIGKALSEKIGVNINDKILIYTINLQNQRFSDYKFKQFIVSGIYETGMMQYDASLVFVDFNLAQSLADYSANTATSIDIMLNDYNKAPELSLFIEDFLGFPHFTLTVFDLHSAIFAWIELQKEPIPLVLGLITLVAALNIITAILVLIVEKTYSIGILRAIGIKNSDLMKIFIYRGMKIGVCGSLSGAGISYLLLMLQKHFELIKLKGEIYFLNVAPVEISASNFLLVISTSIVLTFLVTWIPAVITLKISPLKVLRFR